MENRIITLLAGKAATEIIYNKCDTGTESDIRRAYDITARLIDDYCKLDFYSFYRGESTSEKVKENKLENINKSVEKYYIKAKEILIENKSKLDNLAIELKAKKILFQEEIQNIINNS